MLSASLGITPDRLPGRQEDWTGKARRPGLGGSSALDTKPPPRPNPAPSPSLPGRARRRPPATSAAPRAGGICAPARESRPHSPARLRSRVHALLLAAGLLLHGGGGAGGLRARPAARGERRCRLCRPPCATPRAATATARAETATAATARAAPARPARPPPRAGGGTARRLQRAPNSPRAAPGHRGQGCRLGNRLSTLSGALQCFQG